MSYLLSIKKERKKDRIEHEKRRRSLDDLERIEV